MKAAPAPSEIVSKIAGLGICSMVGILVGLAATAEAGCVYIDTCSESLTCKSAGAGIWVTVSPAGNQLWDGKGPLITEECQRLQWSNSSCTTGKMEADYGAESCGNSYP